MAYIFQNLTLIGSPSSGPAPSLSRTFFFNNYIIKKHIVITLSPTQAHLTEI